jgi:putative transposase
MRKIAPSEQKRQEIARLRQRLFDSDIEGAAWVSELVRRSTEYVVQQLLEAEQGEFLQRGRYERRGDGGGQRNGYLPGTILTAEGALSVKKPQVRETVEPYRSAVWARLSTKSEVLQAMVTEMYVRGLSVRDVEETLSQATGAFVLSDSAVSEVTKRLMDEYEAFVQRDLSEFDVAYLFGDAVYEPLRRYGTKTGVLCAWAICTDGSRVLLHLETANREATEACKAFLENMLRRGLRVPMTITSDGAPGMCAAIDTVFPRSLRLRCWFHKMQNLQQKVPPAAWPEFKQMVVAIRDAASVEAAREKALELCARYEHHLPSACACLRDDLGHLGQKSFSRAESVREVSLDGYRCVRGRPGRRCVGVWEAF